MKALLGLAQSVPLGRVLVDYRRWILPLAMALVANIAVLVGVVLPLSASADAADVRAARASASLSAAAGELRSAEQARDGSTEAAADLERFYGEVLPADVAAARRLTHLKFSQMAREHGVRFQRSSSSPERVAGSSLERLRVTYSLEGDYDDIRAFIYDVETASDFLVIENVVLAEGTDEQSPLVLGLNLSTYYRGVSGEP